MTQAGECAIMSGAGVRQTDGRPPRITSPDPSDAMPRDNGQPDDETPLVLDGVGPMDFYLEDARVVKASPPPPPVEPPPEWAAAAADTLARSYAGTYSAATGEVARAIDDVAGDYASTKATLGRALDAEVKKLEKSYDEAYGVLSDAGFEPAWSRAMKMDELAQDDLADVRKRVLDWVAPPAPTAPDECQPWQWFTPASGAAYLVTPNESGPAPNDPMVNGPWWMKFPNPDGSGGFLWVRGWWTESERPAGATIVQSWDIPADQWPVVTSGVGCGGAGQPTTPTGEPPIDVPGVWVPPYALPGNPACSRWETRPFGPGGSWVWVWVDPSGEHPEPPQPPADGGVVPQIYTTDARMYFCPSDGPPVPTSPPPTFPPGPIESECPQQCPAPVVQCPSPPIVVMVPPPPPTSPPPPPPPPVPVPVPVPVPPKPGEEPKPDEPEKVRPIGITPGPPNLSAVNWDISSACDTADSLAEGVPEERPSPGGGSNPPTWQTWVAAAGEAYSWTIPGLGPIVSGALTYLRDDGSPLAQLATAHTVGSSVSTAIKAFLPGDSVPHGDMGFALASKLGLVATAEKLTGSPYSYMYTSTMYLYQFANPQYIPGQSDIDAMYLSNRITSAYWECLTKAQGNLPGLHSLALGAKQSRPNPSDVVSLHLRGVIPTQAEYVKRMRELGYVDPGHAVEELKLAEQLPGYSDLLRFMVRDSADDKVADAYGYDTDFTTKFGPKIREWAKAQGITEDVFRYFWRAHWDIPSNTALYSMYHRLRPGRDEIQQWAKDNQTAIAEFGPDFATGMPPVVTLDDVRQALEVNDVAPGWVERLLAVSFHPVTNTDARRAFMIGFKSKDWLIERMQDNGYSLSDSKTLADFFEAEKNRTIQAQTGVASARKILAAYKNGSMSRADAFRLLEDTFPSVEDRQRMLYKSEIERDTETVTLELKGLEKRYVYGEIDAVVARKLLANAGIDGAAIDPIIRRFDARKFGHRKEPRVAMIAEWYSLRMIDADEFYRRLDRLGYANDDAVRIAEATHAKRSAKEAAQAAARAEKMRREAKATAKDVLNELRYQEKELKKKIAELEKKLKEKEKESGQGGEPAGESGTG